ncbi:MAG: hypothetical protein JNM77_08730 [Pseudonocardia sp.]|nr:hypothetical protein [Pseudonocardia sp.]
MTEPVPTELAAEVDEALAGVVTPSEDDYATAAFLLAALAEGQGECAEQATGRHPTPAGLALAVALVAAVELRAAGVTL